MSPGALIFMLLSWGVVIGLLVFCYRRIFETGTTFEDT